MAALLIIIAAALVSSSYAFTCPVSADCYCSQGSEHIIITCPKRPVTEHLEIRFQPGDFVRFQCNYERNDTRFFRYAQGMEFGEVKHAIFLSCELPDATFSELFSAVGISGVQTLQFMSHKELGDRLQPNHFRGLNLTYLSLDWNKFTSFPPAVFDGMDHLQSLNLRLNRLRFPPEYTFNLPSLTFLELGDNELETLPREIFWNLTSLNTLNMERNKFRTLSREWFQNLPNLTVLELQDNSLENLPDDVFNDLTQLRSIRMFQNKLETIPDSLFSHNGQLETINLVANSHPFGMLSQGVFAGLRNLTQLFLNRSGISEVSEQLFQDSVALKNLSLQGNLLINIPEKLFQNATSLVDLDLSYNLIESLPPSIFRGLSKLLSLSLQHNRLVNLTSNLFLNLPKLKSLHLHGNQIMYIAQDAFPNMAALTYLDLSSNRLNFSGPVRESVFNNCQRLQVLKLRNNRIESLAFIWAVTLIDLTELDLRDNHITLLTNYDLGNFISRKVQILLQNNLIETVEVTPLIDVVHLPPEPNAPRNVSAFLDGNPLKCDCNVLEFVQLLSTDFGAGFKQSISLFVNNLTCASPPRLASRLVKRIDPAELLCNVTEDCPERCRCDLQPARYALIVNCTGASYMNLPDVIPTTNQHRYMYNHTVLIMNDNRLRYVDAPFPPSYGNMTELYLSRNNVTRIRPEAIPPKVHVLHLDGNNLTRLPVPLVLRISNFTNLEVTLRANPWACDCEAVTFQKFLQDRFRNVTDADRVQCGGNGPQISTLTADELCPGHTRLIVTLSVTLASLALVLTVVSVMYYRNKHLVQVWLYSRNMCMWCVTEQEMDRDKSYDAFVSYSHKDEEFVVEKLVSKLETELPKFKLCVHYRDWVAGEFIPNQIVSSVESSRRTIVVLSKNFLESVWGRMEFKAAHLQALQDRTRRVIIIVYGEVPPSEELDEELRAYVTMNTYLKWDDPWFWQKLRYAMPHPPAPKAFGRRKDDKLELIRAEILNNRSPRTSTSTA